MTIHDFLRLRDEGREFQILIVEQWFDVEYSDLGEWSLDTIEMILAEGTLRIKSDYS